MTVSRLRSGAEEHRRSPGPLRTLRPADATTTAGSVPPASRAATRTRAPVPSNSSHSRSPIPLGRWHSSRPHHTPAATAGRKQRLATDRCVAHIDALYLLAYLYLGETTIAEAAVVNAVAGTVDDPAATVGGPPWVWRILTSHVHPDTDGTGHLRRQREAVALIAAGRTPSEAGILLGITSTQVHRDVWTAIPAIQAHLGLLSPTSPSLTADLAAEAERSVRAEGPRSGADAPSADVSDSAGADGAARSRAPHRSISRSDQHTLPSSRNTLLTEETGI
jgi:hypothetical protein